MTGMERNLGGVMGRVRSPQFSFPQPQRIERQRHSRQAE